MGTRNLTMVISDGETKVAQYGQWDGYPSGQGVTVQKFIKKYSVKKFKEVLNYVEFIDDRKRKEIDRWFKSIGVKDGWMDMDQSALYHKKYPLLTRDNGAAILSMIMTNNDDTIWLNDSTNFGGDSLFCEWAYVLDLDKRVLEVYNGFNKEDKNLENRFAKYDDGKSEYRHISLLTTYTFAEMKKMTSQEFVEKTNKLEEDRELWLEQQN